MARIAIIWSGFWWLSAAIHCAHWWHEVDVYEKNEQVGGRASVLKKNWFRRDMWPSWYLMPDLFEEFFQWFWLERKDFINLTPIDPSYRIYFKDSGKHIDVYKNVERNREAFEEIEPGSTDKLIDYLKISKHQYEVAMKEFVIKNYDSIRDFFTRRMMTEWRKMNVLSNLHNHVKKYFKTDEMQKIMEYPLVFLWTAPSSAPALYNIMTHVDFNGWVWYPDGWIYAIIDALSKIAISKWVNFYLNSPVKEIVVDAWIASWIIVNWELKKYDAIISNADYHFTETKLLDTKRQTFGQSYRDKKIMAPSGFILYLWVKGEVTWLDHHTLIFCKDWAKNFDDIFKDKVAPADPSLYVCCPSKSDKSVAPEGYENLFVLVPFPPGIELRDKEQKAYRDKVLSIIEDEIGDKFTDRIVEEEFFCVKEFKERYNAFQWSALGLAHTLKQTAIFRPNTISKKVKNLFYAWGYTNPWIWMPMCLISWKLAYERVEKLFK